MLWTLFEIGVNIYQALLMVLFLRNRLPPKAKFGTPDLICISLISVFFSLYLFFDITISDTFVFVIPLVYSFCCFSNKWYIKVFWVFMMAILMIGIINLSISIFSSAAQANWSTIMAKETLLRASFILTTNIALGLVVFIISKCSKYSTPLSIASLVILFFQNLACIVLLESLFSIKQTLALSDTSYVIACLCTFICSCSSFVEYEIMSANAEKEQHYKQEIQMLQLTEQHQKDLQSIYNQLIVSQHDLKHMIQSVERLMEPDHYNEKAALLCEMKQQILPLEFATGNVAIDALLTAKHNLMIEKGIQFEFFPQSLADFPLSGAECCTVLGNLLDNAIEGIERISSISIDKKIRLEINRIWNVYCIRCENPVNATTLHISKDTFLSSKEGGLHGIGTQSVKRIVESANGSCSFTVENGLFVASIILMNEKE